MGLLDKLKGALGAGLLGKGGAGDVDSGQYYYVRCQKCGEKVRLRVARWDLCEEFDGDGDVVSGYTCNKDVVGQKCFRPIHVTLEFDRNRRETSRSISGGEFITREEYEAEEVVGGGAQSS